jgi:hypothetical protein
MGRGENSSPSRAGTQTGTPPGSRPPLAGGGGEAPTRPNLSQGLAGTFTEDEMSAGQTLGNTIPSCGDQLGQTEALERLRADERRDLFDLAFPQGEDVEAVRLERLGLLVPEVARQRGLSVR